MKESSRTKKRYDFLTPYEEWEKKIETKRQELTEEEKADKNRFLELAYEIISKHPKKIDPKKRQWLEKTAFPYFIELAETNIMRVELDIDEDGTHGQIICTALEFTLYDDLWMDWENLSDIISRTSSVVISPKDNYVVAKFGFLLYESS